MENRFHNPCALKRRVAGFTLMEVLVTVVILSIGLLGVAGLQLNSLRGNQNALEVAAAVALVLDGADRVRANLPAVRNSSTGDFLATQLYAQIDAAGSDPGCESSACTPAQIVQKDAFEWITAVKAQLPGGVGVICQDNTPNDGRGGSTSEPWDPMCDQTSTTFAVKVAWDHDRDPTTPFVVYRTSFKP